MARVCCAAGRFGSQFDRVMKQLESFAEALARPDVALSLFEVPEQRQAAAHLLDELQSLAATSGVSCGLEPLGVSLLVDGAYQPAIELGNRGRRALDGVPDAERHRLASAMADLLRCLGGEGVWAYTRD